MARKPPIAPRKPGIAASAAQRFVEGHKPGHQGAGTSSTQRIPRADGSEVARTIAYLPPPIKKKLDRWCFENDVTISDKIAELVTSFLGEA